MIQFNCSCGQILSAQDADAGKTTQCPKCTSQLTIPSLTATQPSQPLAAPQTPPAPTEDIRRGRPRDRYGDYDADRRRERRPQESGMSGKALTAMILGLLSFFCPVVLSIVAIILGFLGLADTRRGKTGGALAVIGIVLGFLSMFVVIPAGLFFAIDRVRTAAMRLQSQNNIKQITLSMHSFNDSYKTLPAHAIYSTDGKPLLSWRVAILPFIEEQGLYQQFKMDEPWDSPHNIRLLKMMPRTYGHPFDPNAQQAGLTYYQAFVGEPNEQARPIYVRGKHRTRAMGLSLADMSLHKITVMDGTSNTIFVAEASDPVPWTKPEDIPYSANRPLPKLGVMGYPCQVGLMDGSVMQLRSNISEQTLRNAITANDGLPLRVDFFR